ncbi:V-type Na(+)-transporting ATPase subunit G [Tetragenococcus halophilus subsp. halophilus]|uniref:V-type Na(+)-transporting ATPase subunit G n=1 Tax=Tetragenococcus halophilus (strain DSM 20338 / JCM 20259 / NCIMB 9735 / NBRC 12172) TaxID=945021 RepID=A0AAN1VQ31_TETHN|nr:V-type ATP synthase subunit F [Tetragenococcus halophilus]MCO7025821.1 V-type ATP synthase subunit F [Tetragenococcus halophilus]RQD30717.1 V-type ATP synthase subunit F [Tetragenococcus halophilus subsp. halophilus DSM 20339]WJS82263.1 V-type ATP synthase subunit F [Tetragenococcus halophilus]BAK93617.1 V-type Na(+)-transporting ATPase subunit G [Tetragenococcus halophilus NBRC 12172]GBD61077.1 V-type Na(+)-transporting ATPase subunit G [Tetragenococcus halophilus subsp. halophilus]
MYKKIGMMGGKDSILPFKGLGIDVFPVTDLDEARQQIEAMAEDYGVIFITERVAQQLEETIAQYDGQPTPAIIPIPSSTGNLNIGMDRIHKNVEKAIGMNILDDD